MGTATTRESVTQAVTDLSDAVGRAGAIISAHVGPICLHRAVLPCHGDQHRCAVLVEGVNGTHAFHPRFGSRPDAVAFRTAALDIIERAT